MPDQPREPVETPIPEAVPATRPRSYKRMGAAIAVIAIASLAGLIYWRYRASLQAPPPGSAVQSKIPEDVVFADQDQLKNLTIEPVAARDFTIDREVTGKISFNENSLTPVFPAYSGRVIEALATKGETVRKGQTLLIVESPDYVAAQIDLANSRADVDKAAVNLNMAEVNVERSRKLFAEDAISKKDLQGNESAFALAQAELRRAMAAMAVAQSRLIVFGKTPADIARLKASVDRFLTIAAPIDGTVVDRQVGPGQIIRTDAPTPLFQISSLSTLWAQGDVFESDLPNIRMGAPAEIRVASYPDRVFPARVSFIAPTVAPATRTVHVRCEVDNRNGLLKPDMFVRMKIIAAAKQSVPVIPASAVVARGGDSLVLVEEAPGRFRKRKVEIGREVDGSVMINSGLKVGERIVTKGAVLLI
ncbi:MAG: efflux RND transporter periplasmic adaptor subunit [Blastocatellia bacterium]|nr:efflux RND transporter periplasmic adaptor subunit [Blastocatellia bacterium]